MSIEDAVLSLANAINNLAQAYGGQSGAASAEPVAPRKRQPAKDKTETTLPAEALVPDKAGDTASVQERMEALSAAAKAEPVKVVDAGTGQTVVLPAEGGEPTPVVDVTAQRKEAKDLGVKLIGSNPALEADVTALIRKHSGIAEGPVTFGKVPDGAIPAFLADLRTVELTAD